MTLFRILPFTERYFAGNSDRSFALSAERERLLRLQGARMKDGKEVRPLLLWFLTPTRSGGKGGAQCQARRLLPKHQGASKSSVWRQSEWLSWRKRRLLQARRALVARTGAQLARGAAVYAPPLSVGPVAPRLVAVVSRIPSVTIGFLSVV